MKLLIFSDIHSDLQALEKLLAIDADAYFAAGDLVSFGLGLDRCGEVLKTRAGKVWVLPGNHESANQIAHLCRKYGLYDFHGQTTRMGGRQVAGLGYSNPTPFNTPGEYSEEEMARRLEPFAGLDPLILVCHCPPYGSTLDQIGPRVHAGSTSIRDFLLKNQPGYFFCGHIHEAAGATEQIGSTYAVNAGKRGYLLELEEISQ